jgi:alpha-acetolactate decarboxylase
MMDKILRYHHLGIPTTAPLKGEVYLKEYKCYHCGFENSAYGIEYMRYDEDCPLPEIVKTKPHIAFEVEDVYEYIKGKKILIEPNSPSEGNIVAFIEEEGMPIELIQTVRSSRRR